MQQCLAYEKNYLVLRCLTSRHTKLQEKDTEEGEKLMNRKVI